MDRKLAKGSFPNWLEELSEDIMEMILKKLVLIDDFVRFGGVCMLWKSLCGQNRHLLPRQLPLLMIPKESSSNALSVFSFDMKRAYSVSAQIPQHHKCVGSTKGWLVIEADNGESLYLFRPFSSTNNKINLPPLRTIRRRHHAVLKVVLSDDPASSAHFLVMVIFGRQLYFYISGNPSWTRVKLVKIRGEVSKISISGVGIKDIIYYNRQFYVVDGWGNVFSCDISISNPVLTHVAKYPRDDDGNTFKYCYLVELSGELLEVHRSVNGLDDERLLQIFGADWKTKTLSTAGFEIFKLDLNNSNWNEVKSLGEHILFLGWQESMAIDASAFPGCISNCICFYQEKTNLLDYVLSDSGVFNFQDGSIERNAFGQQQGIIFFEPKLSGFS